jgi:hypothetical protein
MTYLDEFHIFFAGPSPLSQLSPYQICGGESGTGQASFQVLLFSPASIIPPVTHIRLHLLLLSEGQAGETWKLLNEQCCREDWEHSDGKAGLI